MLAIHFGFFKTLQTVFETQKCPRSLVWKPLRSTWQKPCPKPLVTLELRFN